MEDSPHKRRKTKNVQNEEKLIEESVENTKKCNALKSNKMEAIIDGKKVAEKCRIDLAARIKKLDKKPGLAVIMVGNDPASSVYVSSKEKACKEVGIYSERYDFPESVSEQKLLQLVESLNSNQKIHSILIQLPLPKHLDEDKIISAISPMKDVDGFSSINMGNLAAGKEGIVPCTPKGIIRLLEEYSIPIDGKNAVVIGRSNTVGKPVALMLLNRNATVTVCHSKTKNLEAQTINADIIIAAVGKPMLVTASMVKKGAVVIDVGINRINGRLCGDVDFESVREKASYITPVPGGVGPMTVAMLLVNTLECYKRLN